MAKDPSVDLVVLDIMLPKMDGMTVLKELRKKQNGSHAYAYCYRG